ncbi:hypothetical protein [Streptomyces triticiradicis]|nr:hypothetical protein [Streptomyces triticiradicis]
MPDVPLVRRGAHRSVAQFLAAVSLVADGTRVAADNTVGHIAR